MNAYFRLLQILILQLIVSGNGMIGNAYIKNVDFLLGGNGIVYSNRMMNLLHVHSGIGGHGHVYLEKVIKKILIQKQVMKKSLKVKKLIY